jgi:dipeptidyl aminopeptidase/acylaminoacyl peptidase
MHDAPAAQPRAGGLDAFRARTGETAYLARLEAGHVADHGVTVADARGVTAAPLYLCPDFSFGFNAICRTPKLSPDGRRVAFAASFVGGSVCKTSYGTAYGEYVVVRDRKGAEVAKFEGYSFPEWLPDGRLLMLGTSCRGAGVWVADAALRAPARVDGNQVGIPATYPTASPDGKRVAFVWNRQLWMLTLGAQPELTQLTQLDTEVGSATWSPDGTALAVLLWNVSMPVKALLLMRPGDEGSVVRRELPFYPYGPIAYR